MLHSSRTLKRLNTNSMSPNVFPELTIFLKVQLSDSCDKVTIARCFTTLLLFMFLNHNLLRFLRVICLVGMSVSKCVSCFFHRSSSADSNREKETYYNKIITSVVFTAWLPSVLIFVERSNPVLVQMR